MLKNLGLSSVGGERQLKCVNLKCVNMTKTCSRKTGKPEGNAY